MNIDVIIPALNEEASVGRVVSGLLRTGLVRVVWVVDNGSTDQTALRAREAGAQVLTEPRRGYGSACLRGLSALSSDTDIVVFIDADGSDLPAEIIKLVEPVVDDRADLVIGSRVLGEPDPGSLTWPQRFGNAIASSWLRVRFGQSATDLGPFRAIRKTSLDELGLCDTNYGWTVEMQIKAAHHRLRYVEVPVSYGCRIGQSKISGTIRGVVGAGTKIIGLLLWYDLMSVREARP